MNGQLYARLMGSSPAVVVQAPQMAELNRRIIRAQIELDERTYWQNVLEGRRDDLSQGG